MGKGVPEVYGYILQWFVDAKFGMLAYLCLYNSLGDIYNGNTSKSGNNPEKGLA